MSAVALTGSEPIAAVGAGGSEPLPAIAAAERVQQLQALLAQVETHSSSGNFASALSAAQADGTGSAAASAHSSATPAGSSPYSVLPASSLYPAGASTAGAYPSITPAASAYSSAVPATGAYPSAAPLAGAYPYPTPIDSAYVSPTGASAGGEGSAYAPLIEQAAARYGLDPAVLHGLIEQESGFNPSARSSAGALGLTQLMPSTATSLGVTEPLNPAESIEGGARYLSQLLQQFGGNTADALAAYNAGPGAVQQYGGVPPYPETQQYVAKVLGYAAAYHQSVPATGAAAMFPANPAGATPTIPSGTIA